MGEIRGTIRNGQVVLDAPADLPDGTRVEFNPVPDEDDTSPEAITERLARMEQFGPWMTPEELAAWEKIRAEDKAFQLAQWDKWTKEAEAVWRQ